MVFATFSTHKFFFFFLILFSSQPCPRHWLLHLAPSIVPLVPFLLESVKLGFAAKNKTLNFGLKVIKVWKLRLRNDDRSRMGYSSSSPVEMATWSSLTIESTCASVSHPRQREPPPSSVISFPDFDAGMMRFRS